MKDKFLQQQFDLYANAVKPSDKVLEGAFSELAKNSGVSREKAYERRAQKKRIMRSAFFAAAAAFVLIIALYAFGNYFPSFSGDKNGAEAPVSYVLSDLSVTSVSEAELITIGKGLSAEPDGQSGAEVKFLIFPEDAEYNARYYIYTNADAEIYAVMIIYKAERDGCIDEVVLISDLTGGLTGQSKSIYYDNFENGEYYSNIYLSLNTGAYYIKIMSPQSGAGNYYENLILG